MGVKTTFLNEGLEEKIYMQQPNRFVEKGEKHKVCKLLKSIYGLKQSSRQWYIRFHEIMMSNYFEMMDENHCVYVKRLDDKFVIVTLYMDDILLARNNMECLLAIKEWLSFNF